MASTKICGICLTALSTFLILFFLLQKNETFFNLRDTIKRHMLLFKNCKIQYIVFYFFPLMFAAGVSMVYVADETFYSQLIVVIGIFVSMQFAMLSILCNYDFSTVKDSEQKKRVKKTVTETVNAIVFDCILCLVLLLYGLSMIAFTGLSFNYSSACIITIMAILSGVTYYIFTVILLTLLLVVKHMSKIIEFNLSVKKRNDDP